MRSANATSIACPTHIFTSHEAEHARLTRAINLARGTQEKARRARELVESVDVVLACREYNEDSLDCRLCRNVSALRRKTAMIVMKAGHLASGDSFWS